MKKKIVVISIILICFVGSFYLVYQNDNLRFKISYEYLNDMEYVDGKKIRVSIPFHNHVQYLSNQELLQFLKQGTGVLYFGYNTCPWCRNIIPVLIDTVLSNQVDTIYYVDVHADYSSIQDSLYEYLDPYLSLNEEGEKGLAVPDVYFLKKGKIIGHHVGAVESYRNPYLGMTEEQKQELSDIYQNLLKEMKA